MLERMLLKYDGPSELGGELSDTRTGGGVGRDSLGDT